jgi:hypothetical protein
MDDATVSVSTPEPGIAPPHTERHREMLAVACFVLLAACVLEVLPDQRVAVRGFSNYPMPATCRSRAWLGMKCPGCGLTRSIVYLAHGDWHASLRMHRFGWLMAAVIAFQVPYRIAALRCGRYPWFSTRFAGFLSCALIAVLLANWLYEIASGRLFTP